MWCPLHVMIMYYNTVIYINTKTDGYSKHDDQKEG